MAVPNTMSAVDLARKRLEDAVTLTAAVNGSTDLPAALAAYDRTRRRRTQRLVRASARSGRVAQWASPVLAGMRNLAVRLVPESLVLRAVAGTFAWTPPQTPAAAGSS